jgi:hypothetical protein
MVETIMSTISHEQTADLMRRDARWRQEEREGERKAEKEVKGEIRVP